MSRRLLDFATNAIFAGAITMPLLVAPFEGPAEARVEGEQRLPAPAPEWPGTLASLAAFPAACEAWFDDRYGLRNELLAAYSRERVLLFGVSPTSKVVLGEGSWVYLAGADVIPVMRGLAPLAPERLQAWGRALESREEWCRARGIRYLRVIVPEKATVYPERLPRALAQLAPTRTDQLLDFLRGRSQPVPLDLRPVLIAERAFDRGEDHAYFPYGVHWTPRGAWAGHAAILAALRTSVPDANPPGRGELRWDRAGNAGDSWAGRLHLEGVLRQQNLVPRGFDRRVARFTECGSGLHQLCAETEDPGLPRLVMFHDSFGEPLREFLAQHFSRSVFVWDERFDTALIESERPDVVVEAFAERFLVRQLPAAVRGPDGGELERAFASSDEVLLELDVRADPPAVVARERCEVAPSDAGVVIRSGLGSGTLFLPAFRVPPGARAILRLDLSSEVEDELLILFRTEGDPDYLRRNHCAIRLAGGRNLALVELSESRIDGPLLLYLGPKTRECVLHALEVRAVREP